MSGLPDSPDGNQDHRIQAARDWLVRAEKQFADGQEVLAAATIMLAQAELRLMVEGVAGSSVAKTPKPGLRKFRMPRFGRTLIGAAALAACFVFGLFIGQVTGVPGPSLDQPDETQPIIQIAEEATTPAAREPEQEPGVAEPVLDIPDLDEVTEVDEEVFVAEAPPVTRPVYRPRPSLAGESELPETAPEVRQIRNPLPQDPEPELIPDELSVVADVDAASSEGEISTAEVALAAVRFLSERFLEEGTD